MASIPITLSDKQFAAAARRAAERGCADVKAYVERLVAEDIAGDEDYGAPDDLRPRTRSELETMIDRGLDSPPREMTADGFEEMRRRLRDRARQAGIE